jgi:hypothetical protein
MTKEPQESINNWTNPSTDEELYAWTMRREAVASCLVEDIFHLRPNSAKSKSRDLALEVPYDVLFVDYDFNWLGRVPCRSVKIAGIIVGIKDYESKRIYTGTPPPLFQSSILIYAYHNRTLQSTTIQGSSIATIRILSLPTAPRNVGVEDSQVSTIRLSLHQ